MRRVDHSMKDHFKIVRIFRISVTFGVFEHLKKMPRGDAWRGKVTVMNILTELRDEISKTLLQNTAI